MCKPHCIWVPLLMYKSLHRLIASYLSNLIISYVSPRALRWLDATSFTLPRIVSESLMSPISCITFLFQSRSLDALEIKPDQFKIINVWPTTCFLVTFPKFSFNWCGIWTSTICTGTSQVKSGQFYLYNNIYITNHNFSQGAVQSIQYTTPSVLRPVNWIRTNSV